jgi:hypothetical protein
MEKNISVTDLTVLWGSIMIEKITTLTDKQHMFIDDELSEKISTVEWTNIDDMGCLSIFFMNKRSFTDDELKIIVDVLNSL